MFQKQITPFMLDGKTPRCCYDSVSDGMRFPHYHQCTRKYSVLRDGKPFCNTHDPVQKKAKADKRSEEIKQEWEYTKRNWEIRRIIDESFPKMLALLRQMLVLAKDNGTLKNDSMLADAIRKEIEQAEKAL